uniref:Palmitoyltransferase n=1 Tax=Otus sunia TaxID=257818 RepID=A0A8C8BAU9_9STRI
MDPGFVKSEEEVEADKSEEQSMLTPQVPSNIKMRRCGYCMVKQPMRAKHCQLCQHCVRRYDHHCPWIENCVGEKNHPLFIVYLSVQLVVLLWGGHVAWSGLYFEQSWEWLQHNILLLMSFLMIVIFTIVVLLLLISHLYLISCNTTTWEFMSHHRISYLRHSELENPFDQGHKNQTSKRCLETKSKSLKTVCSLRVRRATSSGGVRTGFCDVNSSSKLLMSVGSLKVGTKGGFRVLANKASQSISCKRRK